MLDKILQWWIDEAVSDRGLSAAGRPHASRPTWRHQWLWDQQEHVDPNKEATAAQIRLGTLTTQPGPGVAEKRHRVGRGP